MHGLSNCLNKIQYAVANAIQLYNKKWAISKKDIATVDARNMSSFMKYLTNVKKGQP